MKLREIAVAWGVDPGALIDEWHSRADARGFAGQPPDEAERDALADIEAS